MGQNAHARPIAHALYINSNMVYGVSVIETNISECRTPYQQYIEEARPLVAFNHEFKHFVQFSVNRAD